MVIWTIVVGVALVIFYWMLFGSNAIAELRVDDTQFSVSKGSFSPAFLQEAKRVLTGAKGKVKVEPEHNEMVLKFKGDFTDQQRQAMTNIFPHENYRAACSAFKTYR